MRALLLVVLGALFFRVYFFFFERKNLYFPDKRIIQTPAQAGMSYEEVDFQTADGESLNGWFIPVKNAHVTVLNCHGNGGNISHRLHKAEFFHELGINFFLFDYRGYGKSSGTPTEKGLYKDAQAAYDYLVTRKDVDKHNIIVYGKSLGATVAADLCLNRKARGVILESGVISVTAKAREIYPYLPIKWLITQKFDTEAKVKVLKIPKLIVHGRQDDIVGFRHAQVLFEAAAEPKQFLPFEGGHNDDINATFSANKDELIKFLKGDDKK